MVRGDQTWEIEETRQPGNFVGVGGVCVEGVRGGGWVGEGVGKQEEPWWLPG